MGIRHIGKRIKKRADNRAERIGTKTALHVLGADLPAGHGAERQKHSRRLDEDDGHDQAHRQARDEMKFRNAKLERKHDAEGRLVLNSRKIRPSERDRGQISDRDPDEDSHVLQETLREFDDQQDHPEHESGNHQIAGRTEIGRSRAAPGPVDADAHQHDPDHGDNGAGHDRRKKPQHIGHEGHDAESENPADEDGTVDSRQSDSRHRRAWRAWARWQTAVTPMMMGIYGAVHKVSRIFGPCVPFVPLCVTGFSNT